MKTTNTATKSSPRAISPPGKTSPKAIYILAPNYPAYVDYINNVRNSTQKWRYLSNISDIFGIHGGQLLVLAGAELRKDYAQVVDYANNSGFDVGED